MDTTEMLRDLDAACAQMGDTQNRCPFRGSAIGDCPRKLACLAGGAEPKPLTGKTRRVFQLGTSRGASLALAAEKAWPGVMPEKEVWVTLPVEVPLASQKLKTLGDRFGDDLPVRTCGENGLEVRARCDVVVPVPEKPGTVDLIEFKTKNSWGFKCLAKEGADPGYVSQVQFQIMGLRAAGYSVRSATLVYENKDNATLAAIPVPTHGASKAFTTHLWEFSSALAGLLAGAPPTSATPRYVEALAPGQTKLPWQCNYCSVGPERGACVDATRLHNGAGDGSVPKWEVRDA